jgi:hypothetical protein
MSVVWRGSVGGNPPRMFRAHWHIPGSLAVTTRLPRDTAPDQQRRVSGGAAKASTPGFRLGSRRWCRMGWRPRYRRAVPAGAFADEGGAQCNQTGAKKMFLLEQRALVVFNLPTGAPPSARWRNLYRRALLPVPVGAISARPRVGRRGLSFTSGADNSGNGRALQRVALQRSPALARRARPTAAPATQRKTELAGGRSHASKMELVDCLAVA